MTSFFDASFEARALRTGAEEALPTEVIESKLKVLLPEELLKLYKILHSAIVFDQNIVFPAPGCAFANEEGNISIELILGPSDGDAGILKENRRLRGQIPEGTIAFAELAAGNMLLFDRHDKGVYVWLHDEPLHSRATSLVANSLGEFFASLFVADSKWSGSLADLGLDLEAMGLKK